MTAEEFVKAFFYEKESFVNNAFDPNQNWYVSNQISALKLDSETHKKLKHIVSSLLTDVFYTILLGLDGEANIGGVQNAYKLFDEDGHELTKGNIEGYAYEYFHGNDE